MIQILNIKYSPIDALDYFSTLNREYQHYHWDYVSDHNDPRSLGSNNSLKTMHGYGLQTIYEDTTFPYHCDIDPHDEGPEYFKDTELAFGFYRMIRSNFTNVYRSFIMTFKPGDYIGKWTVGPRAHNRIFVPIETNGTAWLRHYDQDGVHKVIPKVGNVYQIEMLKDKSYAEIINEGDTDITFLMFNTI
jgi:hypothetical protein